VCVAHGALRISHAMCCCLAIAWQSRQEPILDEETGWESQDLDLAELLLR
jgi:hypothetical protein